MQSREVEAAGTLVGGALRGAVSLIRGMHAAIAARSFGAVGPGGAPARAIHDGVSGATYRAVGGGLAAACRAAAAAAALARPPDAPSVTDSPRGGLALAALNGVIGDALAEDESALAVPMSLRRDGDPTPRLAVFIHGLCESDESWRLRPVSSQEWPHPPYGSRLRDELGYTPVYVRYNTGRRVSDNGRELSELLEELVEGWPTDVEEIALVGHSMGGLVARSACHYGGTDDAGWTEGVRHVFCLGSPHLGAPLEKAANAAGYVLARVPETRPLAEVINGRSVGIKDMRFGSCVEEDWSGCDPDDFLADRCTEVPFLDRAAYYFVAATLSPAEDDPLGSLVGDLLVRYPSAAGRGRRRRIPFDVDNGRHLGGVNHFQLLNHPAVYEQIWDWLAA